MINEESKRTEKLAENIRKVLIQTAIDKYEDASIVGLCA